MEKQALPSRGKQEQRTQPEKAPEQQRTSQERAPVLASLTREVLHSEEGLWDLSPSLLQELAAFVGNSAMAELLEGDGEGPETFLLPLTASAEAAAEDVNRIRTSPPALSPLWLSRVRDGPIPAASAARRVRERT